VKPESIKTGPNQTSATLGLRKVWEYGVRFGNVMCSLLYNGGYRNNVECDPKHHNRWFMGPEAKGAYHHFPRDLPDLVDVHNNNNNNIEIEEGNHIFMATIHLKDTHHFLCSLSTILQWLAEAFTKNSGQTSFQDSMPESLHDFKDVFNKESFDSLPDQCKWDHAIKLECDPELGFCKVYTMTLSRQNSMTNRPLLAGVACPHVPNDHEICVGKDLNYSQPSIRECSMSRDAGN
jgi:hypothetical protein